jgi:hypothetical protein
LLLQPFPLFDSVLNLGCYSTSRAGSLTGCLCRFPFDCFLVTSELLSKLARLGLLRLLELAGFLLRLLKLLLSE